MHPEAAFTKKRIVLKLLVVSFLQTDTKNQVQPSTCKFNTLASLRC